MISGNVGSCWVNVVISVNVFISERSGLAVSNMIMFVIMSSMV